MKLTFYQYNQMGVYIKGRRGTGAWEFLAIDTESPYIDERPLLAAGIPNGDWTDVVKVTLSPQGSDFRQGNADTGMNSFLSNHSLVRIPRSSNFFNAMPFDPTQPANNSPASSVEMRSQLTSLNADIQPRRRHARHGCRWQLQPESDAGSHQQGG